MLFFRRFIIAGMTAVALFSCKLEPEPDNIVIRMAVDDKDIKLGQTMENLSEKSVSIGHFETFRLIMIDHQPLPFFALLTTNEIYEQNLDQGIKENKALRAAMARAFGKHKIDIYVPGSVEEVIVFLAMRSPSGQYWNPTDYPGPSPLGLPPLEPMNDEEKTARVENILNALKSEDINFIATVR